LNSIILTQTIAEIWNTLKSHIDSHEHKDAAESLVAFMIDMGAEPDDIKTSFRGESVVTKALKEYIAVEDPDEEYDDDYDEDSSWDD
jgi:hypothetical protein